MQFKSFMEALKGKQHKIDKNKNNKIDAQDFEILRKEEAELEESEDRMARADYKVSPSGRKSHKEIVFTSGQEDKTKETVEEEMTDAQMKKREEIVKSMKKNKAGFKDRYGDRAKTVMYATATKMAMKEEAEELDEKSDQAKQNKTMKNMMDASRGARFKLNNPVPDAEPEHKTARAHNVAIGRALRNEEVEELEEGDLSIRHLYNKFADAHANGNDTKPTEKAIRKVHGDEVFKHIKKAAHSNLKGDIDAEERHFDKARTAGNKTDRIGGTVGRGRSEFMRKRREWSEEVEQVEEGWYEKPASAYRRKGDEIGGGSSTNFSPNSRATLSRKDNVPFDGPYTKVKGDVKDKSGAVHSPMSRAKHLAKMAMKKSMKEDIDRLFEKDDSEYNYEGEMAVTQLKTISRHAEALQAKMKPDTNLPEWVQSKITLATDYMQTAHDYLMSELDEQAPVAPVPGMKFKNQAVMVHPETKSRVVINRKNIDNYTSDGYKEVRPGQKLKEDEEVKFSYTELMMINEIKLADLPVRRVKGHSYGADYSDPEGADDMWDKESLKKPTAEKRGRGRPAGSQSGARKNYGSSKLHTK